MFSRGVSPGPGNETLSNELSVSIDDHTGSDVNLELASYWIQDCLRNHEKCADKSRLHRRIEDLPSRLIDLSNLDKPYVIDTEDAPDNDNYLTLSYCWGYGKRLLSLTQTIEQFKKELPADRMPLTFCEAFKVTTALGYRYIWIDALCIVQDDPSDLYREMMKMGNIYSNSAVTIFAGNGASVDSGLFSRRDGPKYKPTTVMARTKRRDNGMTLEQELTFLHPRYGYNNPLSTRAWVLQEQALAQRQLIFTPREIKWTCKSKHLTEWSPNESTAADQTEKLQTFPSSTALTPIRSLIASFSQTTPTTKEVAGSKQHYGAWYHTVASYSPRNLSVATDKLPAISAVARLISEQFGCEYGAGLFKDDLQTGLCWSIDRNPGDVRENELTTQQTYIAPSWSWASLGSRPVIYKSGHHDDLAPEEGLELVDWHFTYAPGAIVPYGQLTSGILWVNGHLREYVLVPHFAAWTTWPETERRGWHAYTVDTTFGSGAGPPVTTGTVALDSPEIYLELKERFEDMDLRHEAFREAPQEYVKRGMRVRALVTHVQREEKWRHVLALILVEEDGGRGEFRRIGLSMRPNVSYEEWDRENVLWPRRTVSIV